METHPDSRSPDGCFDRTSSSLTVDNVYEIAKLIGTEVEKLIDGYGKESVEGLVPKIVKVLELMESFASRNHAHKQREEELLRTFETIQLQQQKKRGGKESEESNERIETRVRDTVLPPFCKQYRRCNTLSGRDMCVITCYNSLSQVVTSVSGHLCCVVTNMELIDGQAGDYMFYPPKLSLNILI